ncbi:MAG: hypothetical protein EB015_15310 [Methylocystaceae bacterium]|nr:hypothetical protein [Methylocystaceae bacterium]
MLILAGMLVLGFIANLLIRPVAEKWFMSDEEVAQLQAQFAKAHEQDTTGSFGIGRGGLDGSTALAWTLIGIPIAWGVWITFSKALILFK